MGEHDKDFRPAACRAARLRICAALLCVAAGWGLVLPACGRKDDPGLPLRLAPEAVGSAQSFARSGGAVLMWKPPVENTAGAELLDLAGFRIYREKVRMDDECAGCPPVQQLHYDASYAGPRGLVPERTWQVYYDRGLAVGHVYTYTIRAYNVRGIEGPPSPALTVHYDVVFLPPASVACERTAAGIRIAWEPPPALVTGAPAGEPAGYTVYRGREPGVLGMLPLNQVLVQEHAFEDVPEDFDQVYYYCVRAVRRVQETLLESDLSAECAVEYVDRTLPGVPQMLTAIATGEGILLKWVPEFDHDYAGFNIYRKLPAEERFTRLNKDSIIRNSWLDRTAQPLGRYVYAVTAVDRSPRSRESGMSEPVDIWYVLR
jgi:hypothetical protein